jgi:hypothetical protein
MLVRAFIAALAATVCAFPLCAVSASAEPPPGAQCGVDLQAPEIAAAVKSLRPAFRTMNVAWDLFPYEGNFDPCVTLSTALVTIEHATGSSPDHALFFHYGRYLGTATWDPYPFTSLNGSQSTDDTVVLDYKDGRDVCTACSGPINAVRYQWAAGHVQMLDPPPPHP